MIELGNTAIVVCARMAASDPAGLAMIDVLGQPLVARAAQNVSRMGLGQVLVATPDNQIAAAMRKLGQDVLVSPLQENMLSGMAASVLAMRDKEKKIAHVLVLPCTLPLIDALSLRRCLAGLGNANVDGATLAGPADAETIWRVDAPLEGEREVAWLRGLTQDGDGLAHIPVYAWHRAALENFATARRAPVAHELAHALASGLRVVAVKVDSAPMSVDSKADLEALRRMMKA